MADANEKKQVPNWRRNLEVANSSEDSIPQVPLVRRTNGGWSPLYVPPDATDTQEGDVHLTDDIWFDNGQFGQDNYVGLEPPKDHVLSWDEVKQKMKEELHLQGNSGLTGIPLTIDSSNSTVYGSFFSEKTRSAEKNITALTPQALIKHAIIKDADEVTQTVTSDLNFTGNIMGLSNGARLFKFASKDDANTALKGQIWGDTGVKHKNLPMMGDVIYIPQTWSSEQDIDPTKYPNSSRSIGEIYDKVSAEFYLVGNIDKTQGNTSGAGNLLRPGTGGSIASDDTRYYDPSNQGRMPALIPFSARMAQGVGTKDLGYKDDGSPSYCLVNFKKKGKSSNGDNAADDITYRNGIDNTAYPVEGEEVLTTRGLNTIKGTIVPENNGAYDLGDGEHKFNKIYANSFEGTISGVNKQIKFTDTIGSDQKIIRQTDISIYPADHTIDLSGTDPNVAATLIINDNTVTLKQLASDVEVLHVGTDEPTDANVKLWVQGEVSAKPEENSWHEIGRLLYPVGSIYCTTSSSSPVLLFGGSWKRLESSVVLLNYDPTEFDSAYKDWKKFDSWAYPAPPGEIGGTYYLKKEHLPAHNHDYSGQTVIYKKWAINPSLSLNPGNLPNNPSDQNAIWVGGGQPTIGLVDDFRTQINRQLDLALAQYATAGGKPNNGQNLYWITQYIPEDVGSAYMKSQRTDEEQALIDSWKSMIVMKRMDGEGFSTTVNGSYWPNNIFRQDDDNNAETAPPIGPNESTVNNNFTTGILKEDIPQTLDDYIHYRPLQNSPYLPKHYSVYMWERIA